MIVACPACDSRYDVSGRAPGTKAFCRCGQEFIIAKVPGVAGTLACPRCGGNVHTDDASCAFCKASLQLQSCPRCFANVFHGYKHCPLCGSGTQVAARAMNQTVRECPRCVAVPLTTRLISDVSVDECETCLGVYLDAPTIERVLAERSAARAESILGALPAKVNGAKMAPATYIKCPDCETPMNRKQFARGAGVILDVCRKHGTWFDRGELPSIVEFVMNGGLETAAKKELEEMKADLRRKQLESRQDRLGAGNLPTAAPVAPGPSLAGEAFELLLQFIWR